MEPIAYWIEFAILYVLTIIHGFIGQPPVEDLLFNSVVEEYLSPYAYNWLEDQADF